MDLFPTSRKLDMVSQLMDKITLPEDGYFRKMDTALRMAYYVQGDEKPRYIKLPTPDEVAAFLKKHGVIAIIKYQGSQVKMFRIDLFEVVTDSKKGAFTQHTRPVEYRWCDIHITRDDVVYYAAYQEYENSCKNMGMGMVKQLFPRKKGNQAA